MVLKYANNKLVGCDHSEINRIRLEFGLAGFWRAKG